MDYLFSKYRVETFSGGIFAIIITLLVLEIKVPHHELYNSVNELIMALIKHFSQFIGWVISFFALTLIWVNHHKLFILYQFICSYPFTLFSLMSNKLYKTIN